jgi:hypothetical protein
MIVVIWKNNGVRPSIVSWKNDEQQSLLMEQKNVNHMSCMLDNLQYKERTLFINRTITLEKLYQSHKVS